MFEPDSIIPSYESKRVLLPQEIDDSHISAGKFRWPFAIVSPTPSPSSSIGSSSPDSSLEHQSSNDPAGILTGCAIGDGNGVRLSRSSTLSAMAGSEL
jgi:hypothetical protein